MFRIKPYTHQRCSEDSNSRTPNPTETEPELFQCLLQRYGSAVACCRGRGSGCSRPGYEIRPLGGGLIYPTTEPPEFTQDWGNRLLEGTNSTLCTPEPRRKEQWAQKRLTQTCLWVSRSLQESHGLVVASCRVGGTECSSMCMGSFEGGHIYLHYLHHSLDKFSSVLQLCPTLCNPMDCSMTTSFSITNFWSLFKLMSIESVMPSNHLILCNPLLFPPAIFPSIRVFSNESVLRIRWPKYWSFSISPSNEYSGLISIRMDSGWISL